MATAAPSPSQRRLADALAALKRLQDGGVTVLKSSDLQRAHREALLRSGFIQPIVRGWYMPCRPSDAPGDTTAWYASALEFIARYASSRFDDDWWLAPDFSIRLHVGNAALPRQTLLYASRGQNAVLALPGGHSLMDYRAAATRPAGEVTVLNGVRVLRLEMALVQVTEAFFRTHAHDAQAALLSLRDVSGLNRALLAGNHSVVAGRLAGALRACGRADLADNVLRTMKQAGYEVRESNPFEAPLPMVRSARGDSPSVMRLRLMWAAMRDTVIRCFPEAPGLPTVPQAYLAEVQESYVRDAYNSLSIEGYRVTEDLIRLVAGGQWNPDGSPGDAQVRDALAARGYFLARRSVEASLARILAGENPGTVGGIDHHIWYSELFSPCVEAGLLHAHDLAGYRAHQVYIRNAAHVPPQADAMRDMMPVLFDLLADEPHPAVRAVLGHFFFVFIHPYMDGNGRMGRFLMNAMLASGGYPWTVIEVQRRTEYMDALDAASSRADIGPFASFIASSLHHETQLRRLRG